MTPSFQSHLINDPYGDPGVYVDFAYRRRALLFDLGDLAPLSARKLLRVGHVFVSHAHLDHFIGFDRLLRLLVGRQKTLHLFGPAPFIDQVAARLAAYSWNLAPGYGSELRLVVTEIHGADAGRRAEFRLREKFARRDLGPVDLPGGVLVEEPGFRLRMAILDHGIPCLAFALEESRHVNVWRNRVEAMGLAVGPWLGDLKHAVQRDAPDDTPIAVQWQDDGAGGEPTLPLGALKAELLSIIPGQKIVYATDVAPVESNFRAVTALARDADLLYLEATFMEADAALAGAKNHLTARRSGLLARAAGVRMLVPFHFSARYAESADDPEAEALAAFSG